MHTVVITAYKFVEIPSLPAWRATLKQKCESLGLMGNIILAPEGINLVIAGGRDAVDQFVAFLRQDEQFERLFTDINVKVSSSSQQPFKRMVVRIKKEIITMKHPTICPGDARAPSIDPLTLKTWLDQKHDDSGRGIVLLDTRNQYEVDIGTFEGSLSLSIDHFSDFPQALASTTNDTRPDLTDKTVVTFCTGGIRCEKAVLFMRESSFENVYQLDGGILRYFEEVGGAHWQGECFVFDRRVALDAKLQPTTIHYEKTAAPLRNAQYLKWSERQKKRTPASKQ